MNRRGKAVRCLLFIGLLVGMVCGASLARATQDTQAGATSALHMDSEPYHLEWYGNVELDKQQGTFRKDAFGAEGAMKSPLVFLHADPGPKGYSKYLAWFLARDGDSFSLLWCYLNDSGEEFYCWLYRYPSNQLTSLRFTGRYRFVAPNEPVAAAPMADFATRQTPHYAGPDFSYGDWTRRTGTLAKLELRPTRASTFAAPVTDRKMPGGLDGGRPDPSVVKTLEKLRAYPLQEMHVPGGNGWHPGGWRELHALALDAANDPYYLILYSYSTRGYVIDLKRAQTYVTDFGQKVVFSTVPSVFGGADDQVAGPPELNVPRDARHEITFTATGRYTNPYNEVLLDVDFRTPNGKSITIPGFWDGGDTWRVRIAPTLSGSWTWRTRSTDDGLNGQEGSFNCSSQHQESKGFLTVDSTYAYRHHFAMPEGVPFLPVYVDYPLCGSTANAEFQRTIDGLASLGINRLTGGYLIDTAQFVSKTQHNEGGAPFVDYDPDRLNPSYFQALDRRLAYANEKGIVPDLGVGMLDADLFALLSDAQFHRLWRYALARYAGYNVCWTLFGRPIGKPEPDRAADVADDLVRMIAKYDPIKHPLTMELAGGAVVPKKGMGKPDGRPRPDSSAQEAGGNFIQSPAGLPLGPTRVVSTAPATVVSLDPLPAWINVIAFNGGPVEEVTAAYSHNEPIVLYDRSDPSSLDAMRHRLWETRMSGGYWAGDFNSPAAGAVLDRPETQWAAYCGRLFARTRFWRLAPHNEMLGAMEESAFERRRRRQAQEAAVHETVLLQGSQIGQGLPAPKPASTNPTPIYVLADPSWEYLVYFEKGGMVTLDLLEATGRVAMTWFNPRTGKFSGQDTVMGGAYHSFRAPDDDDWVLYLSRR